MQRIEIRVDTTNPRAIDRIRELLPVDAIGRDDDG
jgi:hypothetical protein